MSVTLSITSQTTYTDALGIVHATGSVAVAQEISCNGVVLDDTVAIPAGSTVTLYTVTNGGSGNFKFLELLADDDLLVELAVAAGVSGTQSMVHALVADVPMRLCSDYSLSTFTSPFTGTPDHINRIEVKNAGASPVNVHILLTN